MSPSATSTHIRVPRRSNSSPTKRSAIPLYTLRAHGYPLLRLCTAPVRHHAAHNHPQTSSRQVLNWALLTHCVTFVLCSWFVGSLARSLAGPNHEGVLTAQYELALLLNLGKCAIATNPLHEASSY